MKDFMKAACLALVLATGISCSETPSGPFGPKPQEPEEQAVPGVEEIARMFAALPIKETHMQEVFGAVASSCKDGYDEEYTLRDLILSPGKGVGSSSTKAPAAGESLRDLLEEYLEANLIHTKAGAASVQAYLDALADSGYQIYWPYSENWDQNTLPIVTYDPGFGADSNWGYIVDPQFNVVDSLVVTEDVARKHPVWVINHNNDAAYTPLEMLEPMPQTKSLERKLVMKNFTMLRNYDSWFAGGSEFFIKCGSVNGFTASTEAELKLYSPSVTDFMVVVPRSKKGEQVDYDAIIMTNFTNQLDNLAFLITEDDGGTVTTWKCSATVKIKSKSYGFDIEIPYNQKDDIVWRGQISASYFQSEDEVTGRFGDVLITFALE